MEHRPQPKAITPGSQEERRLAAILAGDVVGYSRLVGDDESATIAALDRLTESVLQPRVAEFQGRIFKTMGDGFLVEFSSTVNAVKCAASLQTSLPQFNLNLSPDKHFQLRIGIHVGEVLVKDGDLLGDGVNIAARLEQQAKVGGICVSAPVWEQVRGRVQFGFEDRGEMRLKNIKHPVRLYDVVLGGRPAAETEMDPPTSEPDEQAAGSTRQPARSLRSEQSVPGFGGRPKIAVIPFKNMSGDPEQDLLAQGISEDVTTRLAVVRWFPVVASQSMVALDDESSDSYQTGRKVGARYVIQGSVRSAGGRVRITCQLIDVRRGVQTWAHQYEGHLTDVFDLQDRITEQIVAHVAPEIVRAEIEHSIRSPSSLTAWELTHQGLARFNRFTAHDCEASRALFKQALEIDPRMSLAASWLAATYWYDVAFLEADRRVEELLTKAVDAAEYAVEIDGHEQVGRAVLSACLAYRRETDRAIEEGRLAVERNPSLALARMSLGWALLCNGSHEMAMSEMDAAIMLSPRDPALTHHHAGLSLCHIMLEEYGEAARLARRAISGKRDNIRAWHRLACALAYGGKLDEAGAAFETASEIAPQFTIDWLAAMYPFRRRRDLEFFADGLRKAGWTG